MKFIKENLKKIILIIYLVSLPIISFAADNNTPPDPCNGKICNPIPNIDSIPNLIKTILTGAIKIGIPIVALAIIYSGFLFVFARGNSEKIGKAKDALLYTVIGAAILLGSWAIATMIQSTVGSLS